jgi:hypothetical protein
MGIRLMGRKRWEEREKRSKECKREERGQLKRGEDH